MSLKVSWGGRTFMFACRFATYWKEGCDDFSRLAESVWGKATTPDGCSGNRSDHWRIASMGCIDKIQEGISHFFAMHLCSIYYIDYQKITASNVAKPGLSGKRFLPELSSIGPNRESNTWLWSWSNPNYDGFWRRISLLPLSPFIQVSCLVDIIGFEYNSCRL